MKLPNIPELHLSELNKKLSIAAAVLVGMIMIPMAAWATADKSGASHNGKNPLSAPKSQPVTITSAPNNNSGISTASALTFEGIPVENPGNIALPADSITADQAMQTAADTFTTKAISQVEVENQQSVVVFSVRFTDGARVDVRASDGAVITSNEAPAPTVTQPKTAHTISPQDIYEYYKQHSGRNPKHGKPNIYPPED